MFGNMKSSFLHFPHTPYSHSSPDQKHVSLAYIRHILTATQPLCVFYNYDSGKCSHFMVKVLW